MKGYIYGLDYSEINLNDAIKIGSTKFPHSRLNTYQTGAFWDLNYKFIYKILEFDFDCYFINDMIQKEFKKYNWYDLYHQGGIEWYQSTKINETILEAFFLKNNIKFIKMNLEDCPKESFNEYKKELEFKENKNFNNKFTEIKNRDNFIITPYRVH